MFGDKTGNSVIIEYAVVFPEVVKRLKEWLRDGVISDDEIAEVQYSDEAVAEKIPHIADDVEKVASYRQQVQEHYRARFNAFHNVYGDAVWDLFNRYSHSLSDIERAVKRQALELVRDFINRCITVQLGSVPTAFHIRFDGDEIYKV